MRPSTRFRRSWFSSYFEPQNLPDVSSLNLEPRYIESLENRRSSDIIYKSAPDIKHLLMRESGLDRVYNNGFFASLIVQNVCAFVARQTDARDNAPRLHVKSRTKTRIETGNNSWKRNDTSIGDRSDSDNNENNWEHSSEWMDLLLQKCYH